MLRGRSWRLGGVRRCLHGAPFAVLALAAIIGCKLVVDFGTAAIRGFNPPQIPSSSHRGGSSAASRAKPWRVVQRGASDDGEQQDWRDFRAKLVLQEQQEEQEEDLGKKGKAEGWAHETPLIEQGSLLLAEAGDHFSLNQQYFHKAVIFLVEHAEDGGDIGLILNRPTAFNTNDVKDFLDAPELKLLNETMELLAEKDPWNVWFGGDCQGLNGGPHPARIFCLHTREDLAHLSRKIIKGVFSIGYDLARSRVAAGTAVPEDFLLLVGYCGWQKDQMQSELDRGNTWSLAAADQQAVLGGMSEAQAELKQRLQAAMEDRQAQQSGVSLAAMDLGDGLPDWERMYLSLGPKFKESLEEARDGADGDHDDDMLRRWIDRCLIPPRLQGTARASRASGDLSGLKPFCILRGSSSAWILGKPSEDESFGLMGNWIPSQYLHRAVLMVYRYDPAEPHSILVMLNGPHVRKLEDGSDCYFGGLSMFGNTGTNIFEVGTENKLRVQGLVAFQKGDLEKLVSLRALEVAKNVDLSDVLAVPRQQRWQAAGGKVESLSEGLDSAAGDLQRQKWYSRWLDLELGPDD